MRFRSTSTLVSILEIGHFFCSRRTRQSVSCSGYTNLQRIPAKTGLKFFQAWRLRISPLLHRLITDSNVGQAPRRKPHTLTEGVQSSDEA